MHPASKHVFKVFEIDIMAFNMGHSSWFTESHLHKAPVSIYDLHISSCLPTCTIPRRNNYHLIFMELMCLKSHQIRITHLDEKANAVLCKQYTEFASISS